VEGWLADVRGVREYYEEFRGRVPRALEQELEALRARLEAAN